MESYSSSENQESSLLDRQQEIFNLLKKQVQDQGLNTQIVKSLRNLFINYDGSLPETACLGYLETLILDPSHAKKLEQNKALRLEVKYLYADLMDLYVNKRANKAKRLFQSIKPSKITTKQKEMTGQQLAFSNDYNELSQFVTYDILTQTTIEHAILAAERWLQIMEKSWDDRHDLHTVYAINGGLTKAKAILYSQDHGISEKSKAIDERLDHLGEKHKSRLAKALSFGPTIPFLGMYQSDLEFSANLDPDKNANEAIEEGNVEARKNVIDKLQHFQLALKRDTIYSHKKPVQEARSESSLSYFSKTFNQLSTQDKINIFTKLPDIQSKIHLIYTNLIIHPDEDREFYFALLGQIDDSELEELIRNFDKHSIFENYNWMKQPILERISTVIKNPNKKAELSTMVEPERMVEHLKPVHPVDLSLILVNLSRRSPSLHKHVKSYITNFDIDPSRIKEELYAKIALIKPVSTDSATEADNLATNKESERTIEDQLKLFANSASETKVKMLITSLRTQPNAQDFHLQLLDNILSHQWEDVILSLMQNGLLKDNERLKENILTIIANKIVDPNKKAFLSTMIDPQRLNQHLSNLSFIGRFEALIQLSKYFPVLVKDYIEKQDFDLDEMKEDLKSKVNDSQTSAPDFNLEDDGQRMLIEIHKARLKQANQTNYNVNVNENNQMASRLAPARKLIPSFKSEETVDRKLEETIIKTYKYIDKHKGRNELTSIMADLNATHELSDKINFIDSIVKNKIRPKSPQDKPNSPPQKLKGEEIEVLEKLLNALQKKATADAKFIEKLRLEQEKEHKKALKSGKGARTSMPLFASRQVASSDDVSRIIQSNKNDNSDTADQPKEDKSTTSSRRLARSPTFGGGNPGGK